VVLDESTFLLLDNSELGVQICAECEDVELSDDIENKIGSSS
jgi:hypothetical protein